MTTIAYKDGILAVDSAVTCDGRYEGSCKKWLQVDGAVAGVTGQAMVLGRLKIAVDGEGFPDFDFLLLHDSELMLVSSAGIFCVTKVGFLKIEAPFAAIGSGAGIAYGAMAAGASAEEAVKIACEYDCATRGPVAALKL
jgi:hypothetical protein